MRLISSPDKFRSRCSTFYQGVPGPGLYFGEGSYGRMMSDDYCNAFLEVIMIVV